MTRRGWITSAIVIVVGSVLGGQVAFGQIAVGPGQPSQLSDDQFVEFEKKLNAILKTRRNEEKEFVKQVVEQVRTRRLPARLIVSSFQWARNHRPNTKYPFVYFEHVLRLQATRIGLKDEVPPFDYGIYSQTPQ